MNEFNKLLQKPIKECRKLSTKDIQILLQVDLSKQPWTPSKFSKTMELMQIALREVVQENLF